MRIAIVGAGAMGSLFAARLADAGVAVTLVDVDVARRDRISTAGVESQLAGRVSVQHIACVEPAALPGGQDVLLLLTKFAVLETALAGTIEALKPDGIVAVLSNGLGVPEMLAPLTGGRPLVVGITDIAADLRNGVVHSDLSGRIIVGPGNLSAQVKFSAAAWGRIFSDAGMEVQQVTDIEPAIWGKVAFNGVFNALATVTDRAVGQLDNPSGRAIIDVLLGEILSVAKAKGVGVDADVIRDHIRHVFQHQASHLPSMLQDRRHGRTTEIEAINGAVVRLGDSLGIDVSANRLMYHLIRMTDV